MDEGRGASEARARGQRSVTRGRRGSPRRGALGALDLETSLPVALAPERGALGRRRCGSTPARERFTMRQRPRAVRATCDVLADASRAFRRAASCSGRARRAADARRARRDPAFECGRTCARGAESGAAVLRAVLLLRLGQRFPARAPCSRACTTRSRRTRAARAGRPRRASRPRRPRRSAARRPARPARATTAAARAGGEFEMFRRARRARARDGAPPRAAGARADGARARARAPPAAAALDPRHSPGMWAGCTSRSRTSPGAGPRPRAAARREARDPAAPPPEPSGGVAFAPCRARGGGGGASRVPRAVARVRRDRRDLGRRRRRARRRVGSARPPHAVDGPIAGAAAAAVAPDAAAAARRDGGAGCARRGGARGAGDARPLRRARGVGRAAARAPTRPRARVGARARRAAGRRRRRHGQGGAETLGSSSSSARPTAGRRSSRAIADPDRPRCAAGGTLAPLSAERAAARAPPPLALADARDALAADAAFLEQLRFHGFARRRGARRAPPRPRVPVAARVSARAHANGATMLQLCARDGRAGAVRALLALGADPAARGARLAGLTALQRGRGGPRRARARARARRRTTARPPPSRSSTLAGGGRGTHRHRRARGPPRVRARARGGARADARARDDGGDAPARRGAQA